MHRAAEERRREKAEELAARQRVREKIERDKAERAKKYGGSVGSQPPPPTPEPGPVPSSSSQEPPTKREYDQCRIRVSWDLCLLLSSLWPRNVPAEGLFRRPSVTPSSLVKH
uniref:UBX domain protein 1 n=1 Tax=Saimiri boliviensis boliviensis TaxID=39432 RepID=A0A2K6SVJ5_SAIBB